MLKITHILYSGLGGTSDVCSILGKLDEKIKINSSFIQVGPKQFLKKVSATNQKTYFVKTYRFFSFFYFVKVLKILVKEKPNLIFLHNYQIIPIFLYKVLFFNNLKVIYVDHTPNNLKNSKDFFISRVFKLIINFFIVLNKDSYSYFLKRIKVNSNKIKIIPNAINKNFIKNYSKKNKKKNRLIIGMAARMNNLKRHDLIIDAIQDNFLSDYNIKCYFAGTGENINFLKDKIGNNKNFKFCGVLDKKNLKKWYSSLDVYIQATNGEGHSTSILQAMGMNLPVLASNVTGIKEFLIPKKNIGILFENNSKLLAKKIKYFMQMKSNKRSAIIRSQKKYLISNFSESKFLDSYKDVIKKLIF